MEIKISFIRKLASANATDLDLYLWQSKYQVIYSVGIPHKNKIIKKLHNSI